jgi:anaerobic ribonucleoside-triphosphate reductase activating protein
MNYTQLNKFDTMNGEGVRVSLFVAGCTLNCKGCFNKEAQNFRAGNVFTDETLALIVDMLSDDCIDGLSILGGDPLEPKHIKEVQNVVYYVRKVLPHKTIWVWTGRLLEDIQSSSPEILKHIDVLIDGPFIQELRDPECIYYGSTNQRLLRRGIDF